jgi:hypothetical protein
MPSQLKRWGGKLGGDHSTAIEAAWLFLPEVLRNDLILRISPGFITPGGNSSSGNSMKIIDDQGCILLSVRGGSSHQELRVYVSDYPKAKLAIARAARNADVRISFGKRL